MPSRPYPHKTYKVRWAPTMDVIAIVRARDAGTARRKAPKPYRKYLGEISVEEMSPSLTVASPAPVVKP